MERPDESSSGLIPLAIVLALILFGSNFVVTTEEVPIGTFWDDCNLLEVRSERTDSFSGGTRSVYRFWCDGVIREHSGYDPRGKVGYKLVWSDWAKEKMQ